MTVQSCGLPSSSSVLNSAKWSDEALYLKEFVHKNKLPKVVKIVKGQYLNYGAPSISSPSLQQHLLLVNMGRRRRLMAQCVRFKESSSSSSQGSQNSSSRVAGCKVSSVGPKLAIPDSFDGFFEILSEDGRSVRCIESVAELCVRFPDSVLVREDVRAFVSKSDDVETIREKSRVISRGETLILVGEVVGVNKAGSKSRFLRCFDQNGENVYLPMELTKCKFSAVAKEDNISGVHSPANLLKKRLPLMVRLVHGRPPPQVASSRNLRIVSQNFAPEMRLLTSMEEDFIVGLSLSKDSSFAHVIPIPVSALIKVQYAMNDPEMNSLDRLVERCQELAGDIMDEITVHDVAYSKDIRLHGGTHQHNNNTPRRVRPMGLKIPSEHSHGDKNKDDYDEIEQIYDYVRGFAPLPRSAKGWKYEPAVTEGHNQKPPEPPPIDTIPKQRPASMDFSTTPTTPTSPVIYGDMGGSPIYETAKEPHNTLMTPVNAKKRQRSRMLTSNDSLYPTGLNRFIKATRPFTSNHVNSNSHQVKPRFFRHRGGKGDLSAMSHSLTLSRCNLYGSPGLHQNAVHSPSQFHLRYKSLTNLNQPHAHLNNSGGEYDTLESSNSGGAKTNSADSSGASKALPEKRFRKQLSRPKSLTNLVFGSGGGATNSNNNNKDSNYSSMNSNPAQQPQNVSMSSSSKTSTLRKKMHHSNRMGTMLGSANSRRMGALYL